MDSSRTRAKAEAMAIVSAQALQVMMNTRHANPDLAWDDMAFATALVMRALVALERSKNPALTKAAAHERLFGAIALAMAASDEIIQVVTGDPSEGPDQAGIIPPRQH